MKHSCGCHFEAIPNNFLRGTKNCPDCFGKYNINYGVKSDYQLLTITVSKKEKTI